jgi:hypothetical protein
MHRARPRSLSESGSPDTGRARSPQRPRPLCSNPFLIVTVAIRNQRISHITKDARAF